MIKLICIVFFHYSKNLLFVIECHVFLWSFSYNMLCVLILELFVQICTHHKNGHENGRIFFLKLIAMAYYGYVLDKKEKL